MLSKKIKFIALASVLSAGVLAGTAVAGSQSTDFVAAKAPVVERRASFDITCDNNNLHPQQVRVQSMDNTTVNNEYQFPFGFYLWYNGVNNELTITINQWKKTFAVANIQSMCIINQSAVNNKLTFKVGNHTIESDSNLSTTLSEKYSKVYFNNGIHYNSQMGNAWFFDLSSVTEDVTSFTISAPKDYRLNENFAGGISLCYGCENR